MLIDREGNEITLKLDINPQIKVFGKSGYGKTYLACRLMRELEQNTPILIIDYSGSFTEDELRKNELGNYEKIHVFNMKDELVEITCGTTVEYVVDNIVAALVSLKHDMPVTQQDILKECVDNVMHVNGYITFKKVYDQIHAIARDEEAENMYRQNAEHLLRRMKYFREIDNIRMVSGEDFIDDGISIYQLSSYAKEKRTMLGRIMAELLWNRFRQKKQRVQIVLDEYQNLEVVDTAVEEMLREGRRFGVGVILISQYPASDELDILEQATTSFYLHQDGKKLNETAKAVDPNNYRVWIPKLKALNVGECIFTGKYEVNGNVVTDFKPLLCKIVLE